MGESGIDYVKYGWNPISGCTKVGPECVNCWAEVMAKRMAGRFGYPADAPFRPTMHPDRMGQMFGMKTPGMNAVAFMGDLFHEQFPFVYIANVFGAMHTAKHLTHLVLTKRADRAVEFFRWFKSEWLGESQGRPSAYPEEYQHVLVGVTVGHPSSLWRLDELRKIPGRRWVSFEPLLASIGPVDLTGIDWCVVGGESAPKARPTHPDWVRELRDQAAAQGVPFNFKQWGSWEPVYDRDKNPDWQSLMKPAKNERWVNLAGGHGFNGERLVLMRKVGKKHAGRFLDGVLHDAVPSTVD